MGTTENFAKRILDWTSGAAAASAPAGRWVQWATQSPNSRSAFDGPSPSRFTVTFAAANSPAGSATNLNAITGTSTAAATYVGWNLYDSSVGGTRFAWGTMSAAVGCKSADNPSFAAGALSITIA